jgi:hypothetical protein
MTKYNIISTCISIIGIICLIWLLTSPNFSCIHKDQKIVNGKEYDSLVSITNRPPIIKIDTIRDTIIGEPIIKWKDKLIPVYKDSLSTVYSDTLKTEDFKVVVNDTLQWNQIQYRKYSYESYVKTIIDSIEIEKPVYKDKEIPIPKRGFYYGGGTDIYKKGFYIVGEFTYISKKDIYVSLEGGILSNINTNMNYYPTIGIRVGKKF